MASSSSFLVYSFLLCSLAQGGMSVPAIALRPVQNLSTNSLSVHSDVSSIGILTPLNLTSSLPDFDARYLVPDTEITIFFYLGFHMDETAMQDTINAAENYCNLQIQRSGDVPLPLTEDPFHDDLGYGAAIHVVSTKPRHRITWGILKGTVQGLWNFLVEESRYVEAEFHVSYAEIGFVGRGSITEAAKAPTSR